MPSLVRTAHRAFLLLIILATALQAGCGGAEARKLKHMQRGEAYVAEKNYEKARVEFRNALQIDPQNAQALFMSAQVAEHLNDLRAATGFYQAAIEADPAHAKAIANLAKMYVFAGAPERAMEMVEPALAKAEDADLLTVRGAARMKGSDVAGALADAKRALELDPDNDNAIALLASIHRESGDNAAAIKLLQDAIGRRPDNTELRLVLAQLYAQLEDRAGAEVELVQIVKLNPAEQSHRYRLALFYIRGKELDKAEAVLREAVRMQPDASEPKLALTDFLASQRSRELAEKELKAFAAAEPDEGQLRLGLGAFYERGGKSELAEVAYREVIERDPEEAPALAARNRIAVMKIAARKYDEAQALLTEVLDQNPRDNDALVLRANIALAGNEPAAAIADLRAVLRDQPTSTGVLRGLARAHLQNNEPALAQDYLKRAVEANPGDIDARIELGQFLSRQGDHQAAGQLLERVVIDSPQNPQAREALFRAQVLALQWDRARRSAEDIKLLRPDLSVGFYFAGLVEQGQGRFQQSIGEFEQALARQPDATEPLAALVRSELELKKPEAAIQRLRSVADKFPENAVARNLLGEVLLSQKRPAEALGAFDEAIARASEWYVPYRGVALAEFAQGNWDAGINAYERGIAASTENSGKAALSIDLAAVYEQRQRPDDAIAVYERLVALEPKSTMAANNLAMLLVTYRKDQASLDRAKDMVARFANTAEPAYLNTQGWVKYKRGEFEAAVPLLAQAVERVPESPIMRYHLAMAQYRIGQHDEARSNLERALKANSQFAGASEARTTLEELKKKSG